jgi:hypothetical protein
MPERPAFSCVINGRRQLSRYDLRLRSFKIIKIRHTLLSLFRVQLRENSQPFDGCRGLKRLRAPRIIFQAVIIIAGNDNLFVFENIRAYATLVDSGNLLEEGYATAATIANLPAHVSFFRRLCQRSGFLAQGFATSDSRYLTDLFFCPLDNLLS